MYYPGSACRGKDLPPGRIFYIHTLPLLTLTAYLIQKLIKPTFIYFFIIVQEHSDKLIKPTFIYFLS